MSSIKKEDLVNSGILKEIVIYFEYKKFKEGYWTRQYLLDQIVKKALLIRKTLYLGYALLFMFENITNHSIYAQNAL